MKLTVRRTYTIVDTVFEESGRAGEPPLRKVAAVAIVANPHAGSYVEDLKPMIEASVALGHQLAEAAVAALAPYSAQSYGKAGIVGLAGEQEHANALLTTAFAEPLRQALGGGKAWISSCTKRAAPGTTIDVPLASKDALFVRSHYDGMSVNLPDAPMPDEIAVIFCVANRGRINARVGGLRLADARCEDGLT
ncbi:MAG: amino acid synthesis family protein [Burkholderiales bacterium]|nr:amino acid synthesis family protein [Burkholderiales bacterium]